MCVCLKGKYCVCWYAYVWLGKYQLLLREVHSLINTRSQLNAWTDALWLTSCEVQLTVLTNNDYSFSASCVHIYVGDLHIFCGKTCFFACFLVCVCLSPSKCWYLLQCIRLWLCCVCWECNVNKCVQLLLRMLAYEYASALISCCDFFRLAVTTANQLLLFAHFAVDLRFSLLWRPSLVQITIMQQLWNSLFRLQCIICSWLCTSVGQYIFCY